MGHQCFDKDGNRIPCVQKDTIQRIFELWKDLVPRVESLEKFRARKEYQNGYTEKEVTDLKSFSERQEMMMDQKIEELRSMFMTFMTIIFAVLGIFMTAVLGIAAYSIFGM